MTEHIPVIKCEDQELPVPTEWRKPLTDIVECLASGEFSKLSSLPAVTLEGGWGWQDIETYIKDYGCKLTSLPEESWRTSIYLWMGGILGGPSRFIHRRRRTQRLGAVCTSLSERGSVHFSNHVSACRIEIEAEGEKRPADEKLIPADVSLKLLF